jgi:hypothetical protein
MLPNLLLPLWALHLPAFHIQEKVREALEWNWSGFRIVHFGVGVYLVIYTLSIMVEKILGPGIPYDSPGRRRSTTCQPRPEVVCD